ncbi:MAG: HAD family phosphatase [bacterium]|nr:HAD family phosphatase [bacterium]
MQNTTHFWMHSIRGVAFDMDGLMVNTETLYTQVGDAILRRRGRRFTQVLKNRMMGLPSAQAFQVMIEHEGLSDSTEQLAEESRAEFASILTEQLQVLPGLLDLLDYIDQLQLPRCVATSSTPEFAATVLSLTGLESRVEFVITASDVAQGKPAPDIYLEAARRLQVEIGEMLVLEDSHHGSRAGIASGACTVAVPGEHSREHDFAGVHFIADSLADPRIRHLLAGQVD